jgi:hypothetical protein
MNISGKPFVLGVPDIAGFAVFSFPANKEQN